MRDPLELYCLKLLRDNGEVETEKSRTDLMKKANDAIDRALLNALPSEQLDKLEAANKEGKVDDDYIGQLLSEAGVNPDEVVKKTLDEFREEYLKGDK